MEHLAATYPPSGDEATSTPLPPPNPVLSNPAFQALVRARRSFAYTLTTLMLAVYFGYILTLAFNPALLGRPLTPGQPMSIGIPIGFGMFAITFFLVALYVHRANTVHDAMIHAIREGAAK
ncbi:hypothetical protein DUF485 [Cupriavidus necator N-1]|jgi:uncharacterized membrane protein (DUF485 family)|uniref:DUF485 domain-containing protein n=1 Tax=Cupriavidus necator (strain ATCC 43291 / DSM 13513 / CCUG 52238 / LMG 8453 / N-1) TaxID=1042878 RepID=F8GPI9_CUPNN|nr:DUF485 domain-containing protein [Cupriavidus necator]AEI79271.1 hypothetical protein DUF485 [Cupriavidus necator N-1]KAI3606926.1 Inner membrane protein YjcH, clustering with ActP [Cupriavidus necator H850]MDX6011076.1 DUF485 domain-containing protein [Cupriavidus necator]